MKFKLFLLFILVCILVWAAGFGWFAWHATSMKPHNLNDNASAIVVLTGGDGRIKEGLNLFAARRGFYLYITSVFEGISESDIREKWQGQTELPECCIILDTKAETTAQNAKETQAWITALAANEETKGRIESIRLVTSNYHMPRALIDFQRLLPSVELLPHPIISANAKSDDKHYWQLLLKEYHKYMFRRIQGFLPDKWQEAVL